MARDVELSPAEALVLLEPYGSKASTVLKVTLLSLLAQGYLRIEEASAKPPIWRLRVARADVPSVPHEASLFGLVQAAQAGERGTMRFMVERARQEYGPDFTRLKRDFIVPALKRRGLVSEHRHRVLGAIPRTTYDLTPGGKLVRSDIETRLMRARKLPELLDADPRQAAAIALAAGGMLLLVPELTPLHGKIIDVIHRSQKPQASAGAGTDEIVWASEHQEAPGKYMAWAEGLDALASAVGVFNAGVDAPAGGEAR